MALRIDNQDSIRGGIERCLEERERSLQLLRRLPLRGDVHRGTHAADGRARIVDERLYQVPRPPVLAVILERLPPAASAARWCAIRGSLGSRLPTKS